MIRRCTCVLLVSFAAFQIACLQSGKVHGRQIDPKSPLKIESGLISGVSVGVDKGVTAYLGVPYAAPPIGTLRWKPPQSALPWRGVRPCTAFGPSCAQLELSRPSHRAQSGNMSEDCLYLNVWTPNERSEAPLPVMVWIHGGGFVGGSGSADESNGGALARKGVVAITINYRLGPFGFFAHPRLSEESPLNVSGNYGILDQIAALRWIQKNVSVFGGDPNRVTIFGASAGAVSVCYLMTSPLAKGLFHRAISESGIISGPTLSLRAAWPGQLSMEKQGEQLAHELGCDKVQDVPAALRARSTEEILAVSDPNKPLFDGTGYRFAPVIDNWAIPGDLLTTFDAGKEFPVPFIVGTNADEGSILFVTRAQLTGVRDYKEEVRKWFPDDAGEVLAAYPAAKAEETQDALSRIQRDFEFITPARIMARSMSRQKSAAKAFVYQFTRVRRTPDAERFGAFHGAEIPFVFCNLNLRAERAFETDTYLSSAMSDYWIRFAASGDPNGNGLAEWPSYDDATRYHLEFGDVVGVKADLQRAACDLFDRVVAHQRRRNFSARRKEMQTPPNLHRGSIGERFTAESQRPETLRTGR